MSVTQDFQKVVDAYRALGYDSYEEGRALVQEFLEDFTSLDDFKDQGDRETDEHYFERTHKTIDELTPLVGNIPEAELSAYFHYNYLHGSYMSGYYKHPSELAQALGNFILNSIPDEVGEFFSDEDNFNVTLDFVLEDAPDYVESIAGYLKDLAKNLEDASYKATVKRLKDGLLTGVKGPKPAPTATGLALLASSGTETVAQAFSNNSKLIKHLTTYVPAALDLKYITNLWGSVEPEKGEDAIIFTNLHLLLVAKGFGGWLDGGTSEDAYIPNQNIDHLSLGTAHHVQYSGFTSSDSSYWTLAIVTTDGSVYERYIALGSGEKQINEARQRLTHTFEYLANFFTVTVDGGHAESSDGYTTTMSYGVWNSF
jgi:hypothetical protein